ncbi:MAG: hypothetical protein MUQ32_17880 [Chloroflexi bacterium]|nr:hypothetical protein [Chloroflexota bacterium]
MSAQLPPGDESEIDQMVTVEARVPAAVDAAAVDAAAVDAGAARDAGAG